MNIRQYIVFIFLIFLFVQIESPIEGLGVYYLVLTLAAIVLFKFPKSLFSPNIFLALFIVLCFSQLVAYWRFGFSPEGTRLVFMLLAFFLGYVSHYRFGAAPLNGMFQNVLLIVLILCVVRALVYFPEFAKIITKGRHADKSVVSSFPYFTAGGFNIEASSFGILAALQRRTRFFYIGFALAIFHAIIYASRAGLIVSILALFLFNYEYVKKLSFKNPLLALVVISLSLYVTDSEVLVRMLSTVKQEIYLAELKASSRVAMWIATLDLVSGNYFGYGIGNSMSFVAEHVNLGNNNVHNIYLQVLLDAGILSFIFYVLAMLYVVYKSLSLNFATSASRVALIYLAVGNIQYIGYDVVGWFFIGCFFSEIKTSPHAKLPIESPIHGNNV